MMPPFSESTDSQGETTYVALGITIKPCHYPPGYEAHWECCGHHQKKIFDTLEDAKLAVPGIAGMVKRLERLEKSI